FWKKSGERGLEGDYWAGKKTGPWTRWDASGHAETTEHPRYEGSETAVDAAIDAALASATPDATQGPPAAHAVDDDDLGGARGASQPADPLAVHAALAGPGDDPPDADLGRALEHGESASPYVRRAAARAGRVVETCTRKSRRRGAGAIIARYVI